ncbi:MAG: hypothetical protein AAFX94_20235, partial [Myxococcota bacterium]
MTCGDGTVLNSAGSACEPNAEACEDPGTFDAATGKCASSGSISCGPGTELTNGVCRPTCDGDFELPNSDRSGCVRAARLQFVHAFAGTSFPAVDIYYSSALGGTPGDGLIIADDLAYGAATPVVKVPGDASLSIRRSDGSVLNEIIAFEDGLNGAQAELVVLRSDGDGSALGEPTLDFEVIREVPSSQGALELSAYHAAIGEDIIQVGRLDGDVISSDSGERLFTILRYGERSDYRDAASTYLEVGVTKLLEVYAQGAGGQARVPLGAFQTSAGALVPAASGPSSDRVAVLVVLGFVSPSSGSEPGLQVIWVSPDGETAPLDAPGRVQLVHAGGPPNTIDVDVRFLADGATEFFDGPPVTDALGFQAATAFARFPSGVPSSVRAFADTASPPGASEPPEAQLSLPNGLEAGGR